MMSRGMRFILSFLVMAVLISISGVALVYFLGSGGPTIETNSILWLRVPDSLGEQEADDIFGLINQRDTVLSLVSTLRKAKVDERISAVVLIPSIAEGLWGKVQEIRDAVTDFKASGKPIVAYLEYGTGQAYYLASACDEVFMTPTSPLNLIGVSSYAVFLREALDKVGFQADMLSAGDYKTAVNLYTETTFTPEHREMAQSLNRDLYDQLVAGIAEGRELTLARVRVLIDDGPYKAADTVRVGLVDALVYEDQLIDGLPLGSSPSIVDYADYRQVTLPGEDGSRVALVYAEGVINFGTNGNDLQGNQTVGSETLTSAIRAAREDAEIEAIVLRVDSPGGVAVAADVMWRELDLASAEKPLIVSMSDLAASGGYYIAAPADVIVAHPGTLTGSIGVYGGKYVAGETLEKLGVNVEVVTDGTHADLFSPTTQFSDSARQAVQAQIDDTYERFLQVVADGRGLSRDQVHQIAQGRVWTGRQAYDNGLVDELGGLHRAIEIAKTEAGIAAETPITLVTYPQPRSFFEVLRNWFGIGVARGALEVLISPYADMLKDVLGPLPLGYVQGAPMVLMPVR
ncbi:MAG TPA: signal peptide peptidase SppA [Acidobacteria bacterium]|nr:signal peptide peptidase SppA [Acidobacteriota bacterium]HIM14819.1 signal peptide peptidase SppA [Acidobacteriota bacterium]